MGIFNFFSKKAKATEPIEEERRDLFRVAGKNSEFNGLVTMIGNSRQTQMTSNMDFVIDRIKDETLKLPLLARAIMNVTNKASSKEIYFEGNDKDKVVKVAKRFRTIIKQSNYTPEFFLKELFQNLVKYSNVFIVPIRDSKDNKLIQRVRIYQNKGWTVDEKIGNFYCKTWTFDPSAAGFNLKEKKWKNKIDVYHYTFNKETDEIFAMPIWCSVIPSIKKFVYLIDNALDSYADQAITRTIYEIGIGKDGSTRAVRPDSAEDLKNLLENTTEDLVTKQVPININQVKKEFKSPDKIIDTLENQIVSGLFTSKGQLGSTSSGRQDAEMQDENTELITNSFLNELTFQLNQTIIREICIELFGNSYDDNEVEIKFSESFDIRERKEKHAVFLFQGGVIDLDEARNILKRKEEINNKKTFHSLYGTNEMNGSVENVNNPKNQHTGGTGTTKKTKKD